MFCISRDAQDFSYLMAVGYQVHNANPTYHPLVMYDHDPNNSKTATKVNSTHNPFTPMEQYFIFHSFLYIIPYSSLK